MEEGTGFTRLHSRRNHWRRSLLNGVKARKGDRDLALKVIDLQSVTEKYRNKFIPRELKLIQKVKHENIIETVDVIKDPGRAVLIFMAFASSDLGTEIKNRGKIDEMQAKVWLGGIAQAINYLHSLNYVHRDLKPENVLIISNAQAVLSDFGFSKQMPNQTDLTNSGCGTVYFMAPEVLKGEWYNPFLADVWSFGCVIYFTLIGKGLFQSENRQEFKKEQEKVQDLVSKSTLPEQPKGLVKQMLKFKEKERISMSAVVGNGWFQIQMPPSPPATPLKSQPMAISPLNLKRSRSPSQSVRAQSRGEPYQSKSPSRTSSVSRKVSPTPVEMYPETASPSNSIRPSESLSSKALPPMKSAGKTKVSSALQKSTTPPKSNLPPTPSKTPSKQVTRQKSKSDQLPKPLTFTWSDDVTKTIKGRGYTINDEIDKGTFTVIYKGFKGKKPVAVKVVELQMAPASYRDKFFPREAHFLASVKHPDIVQIFDVFYERNKRFFIFMELPQSTLRRELDAAPEHKLLEEQAKIWLGNVALALNYLHSLYYCHRSMKPENILIRSKNHAMITDFSRVKQQPQTVLSKTVIEPGQYLSPQMLARQPYSPFSSDFWSFGVVIYETLNGLMPFKSNDAPVVQKEQHNCSQIVSQSKISSQAKKLLLKMIRFEEKDRIPMGVVVRNPWFGVNVHTTGSNIPSIMRR